MTEARQAPSLTSQAVWLMMAKTVSFAFAIALPLLLVRRLSQQELGLYKLAFFVVTTAINLLPLGFAMSAFYFLPRERARQPAVVANIIAFLAGMGGLAAVLFLVWPGFVVWLFGTPELAAVVALALREHNTEASQWYGRWLLMEHACPTPNRLAKKSFANC